MVVIKLAFGKKMHLWGNKASYSNKSILFILFKVLCAGHAEEL
jgi:hypothetical protein